MNIFTPLEVVMLGGLGDFLKAVYSSRIRVQVRFSQHLLQYIEHILKW